MIRPPEEGQRVGRFVVFRDADGIRFAVAAGSVCAVCEIDGGTSMALPGNRTAVVPHALATVLAWLDGRG